MNKLPVLLSEIFQIGFGILLASIGLKAFLLPNGFLDGGVTGIAILVSQLFNLNISVVLLIVSFPFLLIGWNTLSKKIVLKSFVSISALAVSIYFENFTSITDDKLLIAIFGGLFLGAGIGITIKNGAVLDGSEILGIAINNRFGISIGKVILLFNIVLFTITAFLVSIEVSMYSILTFLVTAKVIDLMIEGFEDYVGLMIVSEKAAEIETLLIKEIGIGLTTYKGSKGYGQRGQIVHEEIIHTVINRIEINRTYRLIEQMDERAFIIEFDVNNVKGGILKKYLSR
ncbi:MAG: YitT family protein [Vicingaceae bacterium]